MADEQSPSPEELILAMLRDVLARQARQMGLAPPRPGQPAPAPAPPALSPEKPPAAETQPPPAVSPVPRPRPVAPPPRVDMTRPVGEAEPEPLSATEVETLAEYNDRAAHPLPASNLPRTLRLLTAGLCVLLILINLPVFNGLALARALPDRQALIIRDGLLLKGRGPEIYVLESNHKRWISSLDAFEHYRYRWDEVHIVEDSFLNQFPNGRPLHVLLKCNDSPHIYRLENDRKRWIKDIPTFKAEGHVWEDVRFVSCERLRSIPDGPPIPPDAGPPPQP